VVEITNIDGIKTFIRDDAITVISGPYPHDPDYCSYVRGAFGPGPLITAEDALHLADRLALARPLTLLTRPNNTPVWINASAVTIVRFPFDTELADPPSLVQSVVMVGSFHQALREDVATAHRILLANGLNVATLTGDHGQRFKSL
jgi:hypothetical protein